MHVILDMGCCFATVLSEKIIPAKRMLGRNKSIRLIEDRFRPARLLALRYLLDVVAVTADGQSNSRAICLRYRAAKVVAADRPPCFLALRLPLGAPGFVPPCVKESRGGLRRALATAGLPFPDSGKPAGAAQSISAPGGAAKLSNATQRVSLAVSRAAPMEEVAHHLWYVVTQRHGEAAPARASCANVPAA